jgi:hypothetical protein
MASAVRLSPSDGFSRSAVAFKQIQSRLSPSCGFSRSAVAFIGLQPVGWSLQHPVAVELMVVDTDIPLHLKCRLNGESLPGLGFRVILWRVFHDRGSADGPAVFHSDSSPGDFFEPALILISKICGGWIAGTLFGMARLRWFSVMDYSGNISHSAHLLRIRCLLSCAFLAFYVAEFSLGLNAREQLPL